MNGLALAGAWPPTAMPAAYRELTPADLTSTDGWKASQPQDAVIRGKLRATAPQGAVASSTRVLRRARSWPPACARADDTLR